MIQSNINKLLKGTGIQLDDEKQTLEDIQEAQNVNQAIGISLDQVGALLNILRKTDETDDAYRARLKAGVATFQSSGTKADIIRAVAAETGLPESAITVIDGFLTTAHPTAPDHFAHIRVQIVIPAGESMFAGDLTAFIEQVKAAGVFVDFIGIQIEETITFTESVSDAPGFSENLIFVDDVTFNLSKILADTITFIDSVDNIFTLDSSFTDSLDRIL